MQTASLGSISHGTLRSEDLISAFYSELEYQLSRQDSPEDRDILAGCRNTLAEVADAAWDENGDYIECEFDGEYVEALINALDVFSPPYCYFGAHYGDGSDFGYWPSMDAIEDFDGLRVNDWSEVPDDYVGEVLHVNDHGNLSIYFYDHGQSRPVIELV